jgi:DNA polymerase bacteriophage-type
VSVLHLDFETKSTYDIKKGGADAYARHESTDLLCVGYAFDEEPVVVAKGGQVPARLLNHVKDGRTVVAHNAAFELAIWNYCATRRYGWPELKPEQVECTMTMAYAMAFPGSLANAATAVGLDAQKDASGHRIMLQLSQPRKVNEDGSVVWWDDAEKFERLYEYCKQDIEVERQLCKRLLKLSAKEREVWLLDQKINQRGVQVDLVAVRAAIELVKAEKKRLDEEMRRVTKNAVATCTATGQLTDWLRIKGLDVEGVAKADVAEWLDNDIPEECRKALLLRQEAAKSSTAKLESMALRACSDGRIRGTTQYHGAATGRWAGRGIQVQNFPRNSLLGQGQIEAVFEILGGL